MAASPLLATARRIAGYGALCGLLLAALRFTEYRFLVLEHSVEIWGGLIAALFATLGIFLGLRLTRTRVERVLVPVEVPIPVPAGVPVPGGTPFSVDERRRKELGVTARELEILGLIAAGLSNREIAERLFVSENTVKTHSSRLFDKLGARRRTQAVQLGQAAGLLPPGPQAPFPVPQAPFPVPQGPFQVPQAAFPVPPGSSPAGALTRKHEIGRESPGTAKNHSNG